MADDDIYGNKKTYEIYMANLLRLTIPPAKRPKIGKKYLGKYYCKNPKNLKYFCDMDKYFRANDISYVRRLRIFNILLFVTNVTSKALSLCDRNDIDEIMTEMHKVYITVESKKTFIKIIKHIWRILFPEKDRLGRPDETIVPYAVRHLSGKIDVSKKKRRQDKLTEEEYQQIITYFSNDTRLQAFISILRETIARPQEMLYVKISDLVLYDNYGEIEISEHGKEGPRQLPPIIDSYPYLLKWINVHPLKSDKNAYLFINIGNSYSLKQLRPENVNKALKKACKDLRISKPITCYSFKRNGVTYRREIGESDVEIQHAAGWSSTKQLQTYDLSRPKDTFRRQLIKKGLISDNAKKIVTSSSKTCLFCNSKAGFSDIICPQCKRPLDRAKIVESSQQKDTQIQSLKNEINMLAKQFDTAKADIMEGLMKQILEIKNNSNGRLLSSES